MSTLGRKLESAFKRLLLDGGITLPILRSKEGSDLVKTSPAWVNIRAQAGDAVSPKFRTLRYTVVVSVSGKADRDDNEEPPPDPAAAHAARARAVHLVLDDQALPLALRLSNTRTDPDVGPFTAFFTRPMGEADDPPPAEERALRDSWVYQVVCAESDNT